MTLEEIKKLNDTQLNIMVTELSGLWKRKRVNSHGYQIWTRLKDGQDRGESMLPDFCNNLNRQFILIEKEKEYYDICVERLS